MSGERVIGRDKFGTKIYLIKYPDGEGYDLMTDGRLFLTPGLAYSLGTELLKFAKDETMRQKSNKRRRISDVTK